MVVHWVWVQVEMCQTYETLRCILLFAFSAIKRPAKELRLSFLLGEKYVKKIFLLFSWSESAEVSPKLTFESCELSVEMIPA